MSRALGDSAAATALVIGGPARHTGSMKSAKQNKERRTTRAPVLAGEPTIVPARPVVFDELRRRGWVYVMGEGSEREPRRRLRRWFSP